MPRKPVLAGDLRAYRLPTLADMRMPGTAGNVMKGIIKAGKAASKLHSQLVIHEACRRYVAALQIADDPEAYVAFAKDPMVTGLKRALKGPHDTHRAIWQATEGDSKLASKRFKRTEHLWDKRAPVAEVATLLKRFGWEKSIPGVSKTKSKARKTEDDDVVSADANGAGNKDRGTDTTTSQIEDRLPTVTIKGVPRSFKARRNGSFKLTGRVVKQVGDTLTIAAAVFDA